MDEKKLNSFISLLKEQFREKDRDKINSETDLRTLEEWTSLQTMIIVNEIDKQYHVILDVDDLRVAKNVADLFKIVQTKQK